MSKAAGMRQVLALMSPKGSPLIYTAAKKICDASPVSSGYAGNDPKSEMDGVNELLKDLHKEFGAPAVGNAASVRKSIQKRIDDGQVSDHKPNPVTKFQGDSTRRSAENGKRTGPPSDPKMGGSVS